MLPYYAVYINLNVHLAAPPCVTSVSVVDVDYTSITFMWVEPHSSLETLYRVTVCPEGLNCDPLTTYNSTRTVASGLTPGTLYTIQVDSYTPAFQQDCVAQNCASNTATNTASKQVMVGS